MEKIVVTRHEALVSYLKEIEVIKDGEFQLITHATPKDIEGKDVIGVLPIALASLCNSITEVPLNIPLELRGKELSIEDIRKYAGEISVYRVSKIQ